MAIKITKIKPMFTALITTMDKYEQDVIKASGLIDTDKQKGSLKEYQKVIAVGDSVRNINPGDLVYINPSRFAVKKHKEGSLKDGVIGDNPVLTYNFPVVEMNDTNYLLLQDRDIEYIIEEYEEIKDPTPLIIPQEKIIIS